MKIDYKGKESDPKLTSFLPSVRSSKLDSLLHGVNAYYRSAIGWMPLIVNVTKVVKFETSGKWIITAVPNGTSFRNLFT